VKWNAEDVTLGARGFFRNETAIVSGHGPDRGSQSLLSDWGKDNDLLVSLVVLTSDELTYMYMYREAF